MWPWAHAAAGYLLYRLWIHYRGATLADLPVIALGLGTLYPDLIDKPLSWSLAILPTGRTFAHSLVVGSVIFGFLWTLFDDTRHRELLIVFGFGVLTHIFGDGILAIVAGEWGELSWMLWPVLPPTEPDIGKSFMAHFLAIELTPWFIFQIVLTVFAVAVWLRDGRPGLDRLITPIRRQL